MDKKRLSERDICTQFITPALRRAGWDLMSQIREEYPFAKGRISVRGKLVCRGESKRADYILHYKNKPNLRIALIEAKKNTRAIGDGMQQALNYAAALDIPFVFSSQWRWLCVSRQNRPRLRTRNNPRSRRVPIARCALDALSNLEGLDARSRANRPPRLLPRSQGQRAALLPDQSVKPPCFSRGYSVALDVL